MLILANFSGGGKIECMIESLNRSQRLPQPQTLEDINSLLGKNELGLLRLYCPKRSTCAMVGRVLEECIEIDCSTEVLEAKVEKDLPKAKNAIDRLNNCSQYTEKSE